MSSIQDQIAAAWKKYRPEALSTNSMALSHDVFTAGYLAALRSLFVRNLENISIGQMVKLMRNGLEVTAYLCEERTHFVTTSGKGVEYIPVEEAGPILVMTAHLPSPSDLFTEGVPR